MQSASAVIVVIYAYYHELPIGMMWFLKAGYFFCVYCVAIQTKAITPPSLEFLTIVLLQIKSIQRAMGFHCREQNAQYKLNK